MQGWTVPRRAVTGLLASAALIRAARATAPAIRIGTLRFGSLGWELDVMRRHGMIDGFALEPIEFATGPASQVALQAGNVDIVLQDWIWTSRLRSEGAPWTLAPATAALGGVMVPATSPIRSLAELKSKRVGIAGGPLDKSWLLLRLFAQRDLKIDLDTAVEKVFGPPPLLGAQLDAGRLDATLTYWPFAARGEAHGQRVVLDMADALAGLDVPRGLPMLGYVFSDDWAKRTGAPLLAFLAAAERARALLATSDAEWDQIAPLTGAGDPATLARLRDWYRRGALAPWNDDARAAAARLFALMASIGGPALVGDASTLAPGTFWPSA